MPGQPTYNRVFFLFAAICSALLYANIATAQDSPVTLAITASDTGINGVARAGTWTPICITLTNNRNKNRQVTCRWLIPDADGDTVFAERTVNLIPNTPQRIWIYGPPAINAALNTLWEFHVLDTETREILTTESNVKISQMLPPDCSATAILGAVDRSLTRFSPPNAGFQANAFTAYQPYIASHEFNKFVTGLSLRNLPDRWYGLSIFDNIIWSASAGSPNDSNISDAMLRALREWVQRGGHLILILPPTTESWTSSLVADMLPVSKSQMLPYEKLPPTNILGLPNSKKPPAPILMTAFDVQPHQDNINIIAADKDGTPLIISKQFGFGKVTLVGIDVTSPMLSNMGLPAYQKFGFWNDILNWQTPAYNRNVIEEEIRQSKMERSRSPIALSEIIPLSIAMTSTTSAAILLALLVFAVYWIAAGPLSFYALKHRKKTSLAWLTFTGIVIFFTAIAWIGAYLFRETDQQVNHFSVLDLNANDNTAHVHAWLSLYMPSFTSTTVSIPEGKNGIHNTLSTAGLNVSAAPRGFFDKQPYAIQSAYPAKADIPFRATTKQIELDYFGQLAPNTPGLTAEWFNFSSKLSLNPLNLPVGTIKNHFDKPLRDVLFIYSPGTPQGPTRAGTNPPVYVWRHKGDWQPNTTINVQRPHDAMRLYLRPPNYEKRRMAAEGFLGMLAARRAGNNLINPANPTNSSVVNLPKDRLIQSIELLSLYSMLPPPDFRAKQFTSPRKYTRDIGRELDLTHLIAGRKLIVIGHIENSTLPAPLTVDGNQITSSGWTVVRWIHPFSSNTQTASTN